MDLFLLPRQCSKCRYSLLPNICLLGKSSSKMKDGGYQGETSHSTDECVHPLMVEVFVLRESCSVAGHFDGSVGVKQIGSAKG